MGSKKYLVLAPPGLLGWTEEDLFCTQNPQECLTLEKYFSFH